MAYTNILFNGNTIQIFLSLIGSVIFLIIFNTICEKDFAVVIINYFKKYLQNKF